MREFLLIAIDDDDIFTTEGIRLISRLTAEIRKLTGVADVMSLSTIFRQMSATPYFKNLLSNNIRNQGGIKADARINSLDTFRRELLSDSLYVDNVISRDGKTTAIVALIDDQLSETDNGGRSAVEQDWPEFRKRLVAGVKDIILRNGERHAGADAVPDSPASITQRLVSLFFLRPPMAISHSPDVYIAGPTAVNAELDRMSKDDMAVLVPLMFGVAIVVLVVLFRTFAAVLLPVAAIGISNVWTMGIYAICGNSMNMISEIMTPVIFVITLATSIHVINHYYYETTAAVRGGGAVADTVKAVGIPCFFTCLTTSLGFASLMAGNVPPVRMTGAFSAAGIMLSFFVSIVVFTIALPVIDRKGRHREARRTGSVEGLFSALLAGVSSFVSIRTRPVLIICIVLIAVAVYGISRLRVESDIIKAFPDDSEIVIANDYIEDRLTGLLPLEFVVHPQGGGTIVNADFLGRLEDFQKFLVGIDDVTYSLSVVDAIKRTNQIINNGERGYYAIPESAEEADRYLSMASIYGGGVLKRFYTPDKKSARISVRMKQVGSDRYGDILGQIDDYIAGGGEEYSDVEATGVVHLLIEMQDFLLASQIRTFSLAFAVIFVVMIFLLRSIKLALISMIPNIAPIVLTIGAMGYMGIALDSGTMMIASVAIGIAVDDTIHFLYRFKRELTDGCSGRDVYINAVDGTLRSVGRAIVFTSIVAFCGFLALCFSQFKPIQHFGLLTAVTMVSALVADLLILPCVLLVFRPSIYPVRLPVTQID